MFGGLSVTEILVVLVIALIIFGPRKLPELGKSLGQSLAQFRKASEDFKRTWESEVSMEHKVAPTTPQVSSDPVKAPEVDVHAVPVEDAPPATAPTEAPSTPASAEEIAKGPDGQPTHPTT